MIPAAPLVGAVTMRPPAAFSSLTARANRLTHSIALKVNKELMGLLVPGAVSFADIETHAKRRVGEELVREFAAQPPYAADRSWYERKSGDYYLDLLRLQLLQLRETGVPPPALAVVNRCSACGNFFFSYRREHGITGRQIALVGLIDERNPCG